MGNGTMIPRFPPDIYVNQLSSEYENSAIGRTASPIGKRKVLKTRSFAEKSAWVSRNTPEGFHTPGSYVATSPMFPQGTERVPLTGDEPDLFAIGDIHEDPLALVTSLLLTGTVVSNVPDILDQFSLCGTSRISRSRARDLTASLRWVGAQATVVILGDLVDYKRPVTTAEAVSCVSTTNMETIEIILDIMTAVKAKAKRWGGDLIWVLGNHDLGNIFDNMGYCRHYFHGECSGSIGLDGFNGFPHDRRRLVRDKALELDAVPVFVYGGRVLLAHAGVHPDFTNAFQTHFDMRATVPDVCKVYREAILALSDTSRRYPLSGPVKRRAHSMSFVDAQMHSNTCLTTCRPGLSPDPGGFPATTEYASILAPGVTNCLVAHSQSNAHCGSGGLPNLMPVRDSDVAELNARPMQPLDPGSTCFNDASMSRGFNMIQNCNTAYRVLKVTVPANPQDKRPVMHKFIAQPSLDGRCTTINDVE